MDGDVRKLECLVRIGNSYSPLSNTHWAGNPLGSNGSGFGMETYPG